MANKILWDATLESQGALFTTGQSTAGDSAINGLANAAYSPLSSAVDNGTNLDQYGVLVFASTNFTPTAGGYLSVYQIPAVDGSNYASFTTSIPPAATNLCATIPLTTANTNMRLNSGVFTLYPCPVKFTVYNGSGAALTSQGSQLTLYAANDEVQ